MSTSIVANPQRAALFWGPLLWGGFWLLISSGQGRDTTEVVASKIDVRREVWPILRDRCLRCHGPSQAEGGLRLDRREAIQKGGHTGKPVLGSVESSELLRRLTSDDVGYRMPKYEYPLSKLEIESLTRWIREGAVWPEGEMILDHASQRIADQAKRPYWQKLRDNITEWSYRLWLTHWLFLCFLVLILIAELRKRRISSSALAPRLIDRFVRSLGTLHYLLGILLFLMVGMVQLHLLTINQMERQQLEAIRATASNIHEASPSRYQIPFPHRPKHPHRLGGSYYRGNDERSEKLFNGGHYRTASMNLMLLDGQGKGLRWGQRAQGELLVSLIIQKAPFATRALFSDEGLKACSLTQQLSSSSNLEKLPTDAATVYFTSMVPDESWQAVYPIGRVEGIGDEHLQGLIYLCPYPNQPHYGIQFDIRLNDGNIADSSELWMGAIWLTGNVVVPAQGTIPLTEWFDFLPIPEIEGGNSDDPALLGITPK